ncbi:adhesion G-protein coupled receptor G7 [Thunnus albacares]|uniref:adhesion G-protein coupled receptor G7 n=1 Tax=Thunnus albacares TaxID=8236 RepID=UPI001CF62C23|nr:adhesion G-protein coupled receptor G7 [Thunnus albacares]
MTLQFYSDCTFTEIVVVLRHINNSFLQTTYCNNDCTCLLTAVLLASSRTEAQTPTTHMTSGNTDLPNPTTTIAIPVTDPPPFPTTAAPATTAFPPFPTTAAPATTAFPPFPTTAAPATTAFPPFPTTAAPATTAFPPFPTTAAPATNATLLPVTTTTTTLPPNTTTAAPAITTTLPPNTTTAAPAITTTLPPNTTTAAPATTAFPPFPTTAAPATTAFPPFPTTAAPATTAFPPFPTTAAPATTAFPPFPTTAAPATTAFPPFPTTAAPATTAFPPFPTTAAPATTAFPPFPTTAAPATNATLLPVTTTTTTLPPNTTTAAPAITTTLPPNTTTAAPAITTTLPPNTTTAAPATTAFPPFPTTAAPATTAFPPFPTTAAPATTAFPPFPTTAAPATTAFPPFPTTAAPATNTTLLPVTTTTTTSPPNTTTAAPAITTTLPPNTTTAAPVFTATLPPNTTTAAPANITTLPPNTTTAAPAITTTLPPNTTTAAPAITTTLPPNTTTDAPATNATLLPVATTTTTSPPPTTTTAPTTTTPPTTTPLVCNNGGVSQNGFICICPDEWAGETCSEPNFCKGQSVGGFNFPQTPIGWFAYSEETCDKDTSNADKPRASARCSSYPNGSISFNSLQEFQCDVTLSDVQQNLTNPADLETLAASTQILTSKPEQLTAENVTAAADIANTLLLSPNATESVRVAAVATVSQLLNASVPDDTKENNTTLRLTQTLDQLSLNLSASLNSNQSNVVQPNLVVQSAQIPAANTQGVQFTSLKGESGSFVANRIKLNTNTSTVEVGDKFAADALILIRFPPEAANSRQRPTNVSLGFVLYQNGNFFRSRLFRGPRASIRVLSASVTGQERSVVPQHVEMHFRPTLKNGTSLYNFACVFWNYSLGDWSTAGCSKGNASDGVLRCFCNHTTNFAALWSFKEQYEYAKPLQVISIVGLSFSIFGLVVTIIHHIKENFYRSAQKNKNSKIALLCICISLLAFIITFLSGVQNSNKQNDTKQEISNETNKVLTSDEHVEPDRGSCTAVAALLQFFLVATFMWNTVYGTQLVLLIRTMRRTLPPHWTSVSVAAGWGVPAVIMAITLGATYSVRNPLGYRREEFCWLAALNKDNQFDFGKPMFWGFLLPVGLMLIYNIVLLVLFSLTICKTDPMLTSTNPSSLRKKFLSSISLAVLLGLSWSLGYLVLVTTGEANTVFSILFCICTSTQGLLIFILFTARTPTFRATVSRSLQYVSSVNIPLNYTTYSLWKNYGKSTSSESYRDIKDETKTL